MSEDIRQQLNKRIELIEGMLSLLQNQVADLKNELDMINYSFDSSPKVSKTGELPPIVSVNYKYIWAPN